MGGIIKYHHPIEGLNKNIIRQNLNLLKFTNLIKQGIGTSCHSKNFHFNWPNFHSLISMPCSLGCPSWPSPTSLFNKYTSTNSSITLCLVNLPSMVKHSSYPLQLSSYPVQLSSFPSNFNSSFKSKSCLTFPEVIDEIGEKEEKSRVDHFADKIREIPVQERFKFIENLMEKHSGSKTLAYFNDLILGLVRIEEQNLALKVFDEMPLHGISPDHWTYSILIRYYCKKNEVDEGKRLLDLMIQDGFQPNVVTLTILINSFCSRGKVQKALDALELMSRVGSKPNIRTYNCVLKGLCFVGRVEEAYKLLMGLKKKHINPDIYSYTSVMDGFCRVGRSDEAMELLNELILMGLTPNVVTYNSIFIGYCKEGKPGKGIALLKQMKERGCQPDYISYSTLLHGLLKWGKVLPAYWVYKEMVEVGLKVDERMMNTLLRGLCRKSWKEEEFLKTVYLVFDQMKSWAYVIYPDTYYLVLQTYCVGKKVEKALVNLYGMVEAGYFPRMVVINRIIRGLCDEGKLSEAMSVLVLVGETSRIPSKISYNILIDVFNRQGHLLCASCVYGAALKLGVIPHKKPLYYK